jgi:hypothetical protein
MYYNKFKKKISYNYCEKVSTFAVIKVAFYKTVCFILASSVSLLRMFKKSIPAVILKKSLAKLSSKSGMIEFAAKTHPRSVKCYLSLITSMYLRQ